MSLSEPRREANTRRHFIVPLFTVWRSQTTKWIQPEARCPTSHPIIVTHVLTSPLPSRLKHHQLSPRHAVHNTPFSSLQQIYNETLSPHKRASFTRSIAILSVQSDLTSTHLDQLFCYQLCQPVWSNSGAHFALDRLWRRLFFAPTLVSFSGWSSFLSLSELIGCWITRTTLLLFAPVWRSLSFIMSLS
ncbi:hypothetical protein BLNAU_2100 [Blattamonas nauphoetae]|uniref:Uncharacterized protein n=1 Tax=Blattamonas nauphoetae TaxID=2049346 RepID=A0ABQ9YH45_9EUKA|nr:hypothetical protein BLNAU_2100 [Blattamonas nauphoetae]